MNWKGEEKSQNVKTQWIWKCVFQVSALSTRSALTKDCFCQGTPQLSPRAHYCEGKSLSASVSRLCLHSVRTSRASLGFPQAPGSRRASFPGARARKMKLLTDFCILSLQRPLRLPKELLPAGKRARVGRGRDKRGFRPHSSEHRVTSSCFP